MIAVIHFGLPILALLWLIKTVATWVGGQYLYDWCRQKYGWDSIWDIKLSDIWKNNSESN